MGCEKKNSKCDCGKNGVNYAKRTVNAFAMVVTSWGILGHRMAWTSGSGESVRQNF